MSAVKPEKECRFCGDLRPEEEINANEGLCDNCDNEAADTDQSWGAHEDY